MPTYEYRCAKCGEDVEVWQSFSEAPLTKHDDCGGKLQRVLSPAGIVLKGSGFYKTDNRSSSSKRGSGSSSDHGSGSKSDSGAKSDSSGSSDSSGGSGSKSSDSSGSGSGSSGKSTSDAKSA